VTRKARENAHRAADLLGSLVAEMTARRHAEPGDLSRYAKARQLTDARICR